MNIKYKIIITNLFFLFFFNLCGNNNPKNVEIIQSPEQLFNSVSEHNISIVPFYAEFGLLIKTKKRTYQPDGKAKVDTVNDRIWVELFEPTIGIILFRCLKIKNYITIVIYDQESEKDIIIQGDIDKINLGKYTNDLDIGLIDLINLIQGKIPLWEQYDEIKAKNEGFLIRIKKKFQFVGFENNSSNINRLSEYHEKEHIYMLEYKHYEKQNINKCISKSFNFPMNAEITNFKNNWRLLIGIQEISFCKKFDDDEFNINLPKNAEIHTEL